MKVLVAVASKYGATEEIAERIAEKLTASGHQAVVQPANSVPTVNGYDAFVIGSAVYMGHWMKDALAFARSNRDVLVHQPVWLFSSGPLATETPTTEGEDPRKAAEPEELPELTDSLLPRGHRVFYGVLNPGKLSFRDRLIRMLPAGRRLLPEGDFRDWGDVDTWAIEIADGLGASGESAA